MVTGNQAEQPLMAKWRVAGQIAVVHRCWSLLRIGEDQWIGMGVGVGDMMPSWAKGKSSVGVQAKQTMTDVFGYSAVPTFHTSNPCITVVILQAEGAQRDL